MTKTTTLLKVLLGATALTAATMGSAHAAGTQAGTNVSNTFTLDYTVGDTDQPTITNDGQNGNDPTTDFTVDRLVDVDVATTGDTVVDPGEEAQLLVFTLTNNGNDTQAYALTDLDETGDDAIADDDNTNDTIYVFPAEADGSCDTATNVVPANVYTGPVTGDVAPDATLCVIIQNDIDTGAGDTETDAHSLVANTVEPSTGTNPGTPLTADNDGNDITGDAENVLADDTGTATSGDDAADGDGAHSATASYVVQSATLDGEKTVSIFTEDGSDCANNAATGDADPYAIPGACVEYLITVENTGSASATSLAINDVLDDNLEFIAAWPLGFVSGAFGNPALPAINTDCTGGACVINFENGELAAGTVATPTVGTIKIRAIVK